MAEPAGIDPSKDLEELGREMWGVHHALASAPRRRPESIEERLALVEDELAARDVLCRYTYFYDGKDLDGLISVFHPEAKLVNPRGTYVGEDAIRANYEFLIAQFRMVFHYAPNVMVRVLEDGTAWISSYLFSVGVLTEDRFNGNCSSYVAHLARHEGDWRIREMRITSNVPIDLQRRHDPMRGFGDPPAPTEETSSRDWIGDRYVT